MRFDFDSYSNFHLAKKWPWLDIIELGVCTQMTTYCIATLMMSLPFLLPVKYKFKIQYSKIFIGPLDSPWNFREESLETFFWLDVIYWRYFRFRLLCQLFGQIKAQLLKKWWNLDFRISRWKKILQKKLKWFFEKIKVKISPIDTVLTN